MIKSQAPNQIDLNGPKIVARAFRAAQTKRTMQEKAKVFKSFFDTWDEAGQAAGISGGLLNAVARGVIKRSPLFRKAFGMYKDTRKSHYRPRYSPARMRQVLASPAAQRELLDELLAEFGRRLQP